MYDLLQRLSDAHGISGYEGDVRAVVRQELASYGDVRVDVQGNLIVTKKGTTPSIMLAAHIDEIGFLRFVKVGGWFDQILPN